MPSPKKCPAKNGKSRLQCVKHLIGLMSNICFNLSFTLAIGKLFAKHIPASWSLRRSFAQQNSWQGECNAGRLYFSPQFNIYMRTKLAYILLCLLASFSWTFWGSAFIFWLANLKFHSPLLILHAIRAFHVFSVDENLVLRNATYLFCLLQWQTA